MGIFLNVYFPPLDQKEDPWIPMLLNKDARSPFALTHSAPLA